MGYKIRYICYCHAGNVRSTNQDNYICEKQYRLLDQLSSDQPIKGIVYPGSDGLLGVFDGLGGEACGDEASLIAAECASGFAFHDSPKEELLKLCDEANARICEYASDHDTGSMGTTAAMLFFGKKNLTLCNIGDSRIYKLSDGSMQQISYDHVAPGVFGRKPPLYQNLGIPETEMRIAPYVAEEKYHRGDTYLICSDGLTDMVENKDIEETLKTGSIEQSAKALLKKALENGGTDNTTLIIATIEKDLWRKQ